ncbi:glutamyl-tRNA reductase [Streptococcus catagoni]|uniref:glutamyl-tRNA reductase n=1 Tax=Streptococcus catagoni TaxID=2654874 RepID=UPI0014095521|nr:glutamyl-tRNA reductase [Streptococcus catagoni]
MHLLYIGITYKETPFSLLEKVHFSDAAIGSALRQLKEEKSVLEDAIVSTCNRTELYLVVDQLHTGRYYGKHFLANYFGIPIEDLEPYLIFRESDQALVHLLRVSIGLESKIIGETQVLGQLKQAFTKAQEMKTTGIVLNQLLKQVLTFAKRMHEKYRINARPISLGLTAMQQLDKLLVDYPSLTVAVIGLGEMGQLVSKYVVKKPFSSIILVNRSLEKAQPFLGDPRVSVKPFTDLEQVIPEADVIFSVVKVDGYIIFPHMLKADAIVFDLCLPRTCHPADHLRLYNIETLSNQLSVYKAERQEIAEKISLEIEDEVLKFNDWKKQLGIIPLIKEIRENALDAQVSAMTSLTQKLPDLTERQQKQITKHMKSIINQMIKEPILQLKELSVGDHSDYNIALIAKIFGLQSIKKEDKRDDRH